MKKFISIALCAMLVTAGAVAQSALSFSENRATIAASDSFYIPQTTWSVYGEMYIDIVNSYTPTIIGFQNWTEVSTNASYTFTLNGNRNWGHLSSGLYFIWIEGEKSFGVREEKR